jgi:GNAT superfamily N-acetyltransferase
MNEEYEFIPLQGSEARSFVVELAQLRLKVFWDFPYLYEGTLEYEKNYLETYFKAQHSFVLLVKHRDTIVGATTGILAAEEEPGFRKPFEEAGLDVRKVFYFGESVLLKEHRGLGIGKMFFQKREEYARTLGFVSTLSFCAVIRDDHHPLRPADYTPLDSFWRSQGFQPQAGMETSYEWLDRGQDKPTIKKMQYWIKAI